MAKITEYELGLLNGYLLNAPSEIKAIVNRLLGKEDVDMNMPLLAFIDYADFSKCDGNRIINNIKLLLRDIAQNGFSSWKKTTPPIRTIQEFTQLSAQDLRRYPNIGSKTIDNLIQVLDNYNVKLSNEGIA